MNRDRTLFFTRGGCASCLRACLGVRLLPQSYQYPNHSEGDDRVAGQLRRDKECPFSNVTKSGRVWRKVPESGARSVVAPMSRRHAMCPSLPARVHNDSNWTLRAHSFPQALTKTQTRHTSPGAHTRTHTHTHTHTHARTHARAHTHTHASFCFLAVINAITHTHIHTHTSTKSHLQTSSGDQ